MANGNLISETPGQAVARLQHLGFKVLMADDSANDRFFMERALARSCCLALVASMSDGQMVREYLKGEGPFANRVLYPVPDLLLTDLDMPKLNGLELLSWIKTMSFPALRTVVLSGTPDSSKMAKALALGADYFQVKSSDPFEMSAFVHRLELLMVLLEQRDQLKAKSRATTMYINSTLTLVDGRAPPCDASLVAAADSKRNFLLILSSELELERLWAALGTTTIVPDRLHRWGALAMAEVLSPEDYATVLDLYRTDCIFLIEQLTLTRNMPPKTKHIMLYCELRGIISQHDTVEDAGLALLDYLNGFSKARLLPLAGIYEFKDENWIRVRKLSSN